MPLGALICAVVAEHVSQPVLAVHCSPGAHEHDVTTPPALVDPPGHTVHTVPPDRKWSTSQLAHSPVATSHVDDALSHPLGHATHATLASSSMLKAPHGPVLYVNDGHAVHPTPDTHCSPAAHWHSLTVLPALVLPPGHATQWPLAAFIQKFASHAVQWPVKSSHAPGAASQPASHAEHTSLAWSMAVKLPHNASG